MHPFFNWGFTTIIYVLVLCFQWAVIKPLPVCPVSSQVQTGRINTPARRPAHGPYPRPQGIALNWYLHHSAWQNDWLKIQYTLVNHSTSSVCVAINPNCILSHRLLKRLTWRLIRSVHTTTWRYMTAKMAKRPVSDAFVGAKSHRRLFPVVTLCSCGSSRITRYRKGVLRPLIQQVFLSLSWSWGSPWMFNFGLPIIVLVLRVRR